ncbi:MAG: SusC/RagA family TonB-linked outer membrane protein [Gemmatimonadota bacterium]|nr:SusC/RagA family TonB-linked outer membrane protein [Gemmatimonadota bacterium]
MALLLALVPSGTALAQTQVSGTVTSSTGIPLRGVTVRVAGTDTRTLTDPSGRYAISAPAEGVLMFSLLGRRAVETRIAGRTTVDVTMDPVAFLDEVVVTAYTEQRRADITGAVGSVNVEAAQRQTTASVLQRLDATTSGVTVNASGSPGSRSTVRIRGVSSFQNNDPLYVVDGTPVQESFINFLNPNDITSIQVLKDASAASIYGSRASNGVVVIETTARGAIGPPRATLRVRTGITSPVRGYDDFLILDALEYHEVVRRTFVHAKKTVPTNIYGPENNPTVPAFIWPNDCGPKKPDGSPTPGPCSNVDPASYQYPNSLIMPGSRGTNWWDAVFGTGFVGDYNLDVAGGSQDNRYGVSFNFFNQKGTAAYNEYKRGSVRANTAFNRGRLTFGENIAVSVDRHFGGVPNDAFGEGFILGKNILSQPVVPIYDIQGSWASGKAVGLGNNTNPLKLAWVAKDNETKNDRIFGNAFVGYNASDNLTFRTQLGFNVGQTSFDGFTAPNPENSEATFTSSINENTNRFTEWTWTNTARYNRRFSQHNVDLLLGQEANEATNRFIAGSMANLITTDPNARYIQDVLGDAATKNVNSTGGQATLLSFFGKVDYNFADRYVASFTLRQDGSSRLGPDNRWGTFPAVGLGWRLSREPFMQNNRLFSDVMLRLGWGITGNQLIPAGRIVSVFGGARDQTYYDIGGNNSSVVAGFRQTALGNPDLKWEENESINVGADVALLDGALNVVLDLYERETDNLLFDPPLPATAGTAAPPIVNIGKMRNRGFDLSIGHQSALWSATLNASHYRNKIVRIDGVQTFFLGSQNTRFGRPIINQLGQPIGAFFGFIADGFFRDAADVAAHPTQSGAAPGRIKFRDMNGDGQVTLADRTIIGTPHPDFTGSLDLGFRWKLWDLSATVFGTFGNEIFDVQKEFYVFRNFSTNVRRDRLTDSWTPVDASVPRDQYVAQNPDAKYPILDDNDTFSIQLSSFYVEDGSYVRLRNVQLGYNVPERFLRWLPAARVYLQAENLFTITGYDGLDPELPALVNTGAAGDTRDQARGIDRGTYPSNRTFSIGFTTSF